VTIASAIVRLLPLRYRRLQPEHRFDRFDLVQLTATKASDPRSESFRVDEESIRVIESGGKLSHEQRTIYRQASQKR
jgi:hypothetical protein